jgi:hypothetical protein
MGGDESQSCDDRKSEKSLEWQTRNSMIMYAPTNTIEESLTVKELTSGEVKAT